MYVLLTPASGSAMLTLEESDDCQRFHVEIRDLTEEAVQQIFGREGAGTLDSCEVAWIEIAFLRRLAEGRVQPEWSERFDGMLRYAERKGWLNRDQSRVQGHCEWSLEHL